MIEEFYNEQKITPNGKVVTIQKSKILMTQSEIAEEYHKYDSLHKASLSGIMDAYEDLKMSLDFT